jgi:hypothetical protein
METLRIYGIKFFVLATLKKKLNLATRLFTLCSARVSTLVECRVTARVRESENGRLVRF